MALIHVNRNCNVRTGEQTANPRMPVDITIPRFRAVLSIAEANALWADIKEAVALAEQTLLVGTVATNVSNDPPDGPHPTDPDAAAEALRVATAELQKRDFAATFEFPAFISINGWSFGIDHGALVGSPEDGSQDEAELDQSLPIEVAIVSFLHARNSLKSA